MNPPQNQPLHLDGRHYDLRQSYLKRDIPFWLRMAGRYGGPILELACGTGRITIPLARAGFEMVGLDVSGSMLRQARKKADEAGARVEWALADYRKFRLDRAFALIIIPFNGIAHLHDLADIESFLKCVKEHLAPEGRFIIDFFNPRLELLVRDPSKRYPAGSYPHPDGKGEVVITENNSYDTTTQINAIRWYYQIDGEESCEELKMRLFFPRELKALLHYNGFAVESSFGNYDGSSLSSTSPRQVLVCRKRNGGRTGVEAGDG